MCERYRSSVLYTVAKSQSLPPHISPHAPLPPSHMLLTSVLTPHTATRYFKTAHSWLTPKQHPSLSHTHTHLRVHHSLRALSRVALGPSPLVATSSPRGLSTVNRLGRRTPRRSLGGDWRRRYSVGHSSGDSSGVDHSSGVNHSSTGEHGPPGVSTGFLRASRYQRHSRFQASRYQWRSHTARSTRGRRVERHRGRAESLAHSFHPAWRQLP